MRSSGTPDRRPRDWYCEPEPFRIGKAKLRESGLTITDWVNQSLRWALLLDQAEIAQQYEQLRLARSTNWPSSLTNWTRRRTRVEVDLYNRAATVLRKSCVSPREWVGVWFCAMASGIIPERWSKGKGPLWYERVTKM